MSRARDAADGAATRVLDPADPQPFEELWVALAVEASSALRDGRIGGTHGTYDVTTDGAVRDFERALLRALCDTAAPALYEQFAARRRMEGYTYAEFIREMRDGGLTAFLQEHCVLARLLCTCALFKVSSFAEMLRRLRRDAAALGAAFHGGRPLGPIVGVTADMSDPHRRGRSVSFVRFSGVTLVYKPRGLGLEGAFGDLAAWLNAGRTDLPLRTMRVLDRGAYGWMESAVPAPCGSAAEVERYHRRAGMLICLMYVLGGEDFHSGNVIACGEHPMLVDMEVLLQPVELRRLSGAGHPAAWDYIRGSVLRTSLLPELRTSTRGAYAEGGFAERAGVEALTGAWQHVNTDRMAPVMCPAPVPDRHHIPRVRDASAAADAIGSIEFGFRHMYGVLRAHRDELLREGGPLAVFRHQRVRVVLRSTGLYQTLLHRTLAQRYLRSGAARGVELEVLMRPVLRADPATPAWRALVDEHRALERMDVPLFWMRADGTALRTCAGGTVPGFVARSGYDCAVARLRALNDADLARQAHCIRVAFTSHHHRVSTGAAGWPMAASPDVDTPIAEDDALHEALRLAHVLGRVAVRSANGGVMWYRFADDVRCAGLQAVGGGVPTGCAGVGLFLIALEHRTGETRFRDLAIAALGPAAAERARAAFGSRGADCVRLTADPPLGDATLGQPLPRRSPDAPWLPSSERWCVWCGSEQRVVEGPPSAALPLSIGDGTCCGNFARVDTLLGPASAIRDEDQVRRVRGLAQRVVARARRRATYAGTLDDAFFPSLLGGIAGVGYVLLRIHTPAGIPPLARWLT